MSQWLLKSDRVEVGVTEQGGQLDPVRFNTASGIIAPMHIAPWHNEEHGDDVPPMLRMLRGDFFCAPFGDADVIADESRPHGSTANDTWRLVSRDNDNLTLELNRPVMGATVRKEISVRHGHGAVYQDHTFTGGTGRLPIGHHAMLRTPETLHLSFSDFVWGGTMPTPLEPDPQRGRSLLAYPQEFEQLARVRLAAGDLVDLTRYPTLHGHEDLLMLVADDTQPFAWSAVTAPEQGWVWFAIKNPRVLRNTVLWLSNGGRYYPPFSRRHTHVIGVEETTSYFHLGHRASTGDNPLARRGHPTAVTLEPDRPLTVRYAFGVSSAPHEFKHVTSIRPADGGVTLTDETGQQVFAPFDLDFITAEEPQ